MRWCVVAALAAVLVVWNSRGAEAQVVERSQTVTVRETEMPADGLIAMSLPKVYEGIAGDRVVTATFKARLAEMDAGARGAVYLRYSLRATGLDGMPVEVSVRVPLASTEEAYGEERSCAVDAAGVRTMIFTAGLDEANFMPFRVLGEPKAFSLLLNKYLCRVLAAPFQCGGHPVRLPQTPSAWTVAETRDVVLRSDRNAQMEGEVVEVRTAGRFDPTQCAVVAPSEGLCCVEGRSTQWHCGGTPAGTGWHQVSGECFHRETGSSCKQ